jgi:hypothetical protein
VITLGEFGCSGCVGSDGESVNGRQIPCMAVGAAVLGDLRPSFGLLVVNVPFLVDVCGRFGVDRVFDVEGISRW